MNWLPQRLVAQPGTVARVPESGRRILRRLGNRDRHCKGILFRSSYCFWLCVDVRQGNRNTIQFSNRGGHVMRSELSGQPCAPERNRRNSEATAWTAPRDNWNGNGGMRGSHNHVIYITLSTMTAPPNKLRDPKYNTRADEAAYQRAFVSTPPAQRIVYNLQPTLASYPMPDIAPPNRLRNSPSTASYRMPDRAPPNRLRSQQ